MDDDQHNDDESQPTRSGRVRIVGADPVGQMPGAGGPGVGETAYPGGEAPPGTYQEPAQSTEPPPAPSEETRGGESTWAPEPELPHWTAAPTGEVPAVLTRPGNGDQQNDPWSSVPEPTWREEHADWSAHEESFEPSMLAEDETTKLGSLSDSELGDRQPWEFELPLSGEVRAAPPAAHDFSDEDTMVVPAVRPLVEGPLVSGPSERAEPAGDAGYLGTPEPAAPAAAAPAGGLSAGDRTEGAVGGEPDAFAAFAGDEAPAPRSRRGQGRRTRLDSGGPAGASTETAAGQPRDESEPARGGRGPARGARRPPPRRFDDDAPVARPDDPSGIRETRNDRNLPVAIASGIVIGVIALVFFDLGTVTAMIISTVVVTLAAVEAYAAFRKAGYHPATLLGIVATFSVMVATYNKGQAAVPLLVVLVVAFTLLWHLIGVERAAEPIRSTAATVLVFCWIGVFGSYAALLLNPNLFPNRHGIAFLLGAVITAVVYDVAALATGAWIGSHPLSAASPNKTWEGLIGGAVAAILAAVIIVHFIHPWTVGKAAALGLVVAVVSPLGDLSESLIKRHLGLKDMGRILPGHGGLLDRIDGLLFVLPATYYLVKAFHLM